MTAGFIGLDDAVRLSVALVAGASYQDYGDLRVILGVIVAMATAVLVIVCVVHRRRRRSRQLRKTAEQRRLSAADTLAARADDVETDHRASPDCVNEDDSDRAYPDCVKDGSVGVEVRYVGRSSANCTPTHGGVTAGNSMTSSRNPGLTSSSARVGGGGKRLLKEKTEKVSIV